MDETITITLSALERLIETIVDQKLAARRNNAKYARRRKPHVKVSLARAAAITGLSIGKLRTIEQKPVAERNGYPGRNGTNREFVEQALIIWSRNHKSRLSTKKAIRKGVRNPIHFINQ